MEGGGGGPANPLFEPAAPPRPPAPPAGEAGKKKPKRPNRRLRQGGAYAVAVAAPPKPKPKKKPAPPKGPPPRALGGAGAAGRSPLRPRAVPAPAGGGAEEKPLPRPGAEAGVGTREEGEPRRESASVEAQVGDSSPGREGEGTGGSPFAAGPWTTPVQTGPLAGGPGEDFERNPLAGMMGLAGMLPAGLRGPGGPPADSDEEEGSGGESGLEELPGISSPVVREEGGAGTAAEKSPPPASVRPEEDRLETNLRPQTPDFRAFPGAAGAQTPDEKGINKGLKEIARPGPAVVNPDRPRTPKLRTPVLSERPRSRGSPQGSPIGRVVYVPKGVGSDELVRQLVDSPTAGSSAPSHAYDEEPLHLECARLELHGESPSGRAGHSLESHGMQSWLFGGAKGDEVYFSDLWKLDGESLQWVKKTPAGAPPRPRAYHAAALVSREDGEVCMVVFGGWDGRLTKNDVYVLEGLGPQAKVDDLEWSPEEMHGKKPMPRSMHAMAAVTYDKPVGDVRAGAHLIVFGGWRGPVDGNDFLADMHVLDLDNRRWVRVVSRGDVPSPRGGHTLTCVGDRLFMFGGQTAQGPSDELFVYSLKENRWAHVEHSDGGFWTPTPRSGHSVCYMPCDGRLALFGGHDGDTQLNDFCTYDLNAKKWEGHTPASKPPVARSGHAMGRVGRYRAIICGGWSIGGFDARVYALDLREPVVKKFYLKGKEQSGSTLSISLKFCRYKNRPPPPVTVQWYRSKAGGPFERVPGGRDVQRLLTADDARAIVRAACLPLGDKGLPTGEVWCASTPKEIQLPPRLVTRVKNHVYCGQGEFDVEVLGAEGPHGTARPCTLALTHDSVALRDGEGDVILEDRYRRAFQVILSETFPDHLVLKLSDEASVPLRAAEGQRDLLALVARGLWVLSINRAKQQATFRAEEALRQEARQRSRGGLWGWLTR